MLVSNYFFCYLCCSEERGPLNEDVIIKPKPFKGVSGREVVYFPYDTPSRPIQKFLTNSSHKQKFTGFGTLYLLDNKVDKKVVLYHSLGAPSAVLSLERLIVSGAKEILLLGFCGSFNPEYKMMHVASITKALSEEGTSRHYFPRKRIFYPSSILRKRVERALRLSKLPYYSGSLVSTDAPYRETKSWLNKMKKKDIDFVDMEASAVFSLAEFYSIQTAALLIISDELWSGSWKQGFHDPRMNALINKFFFLFL